jgi:hypothetical protein
MVRAVKGEGPHGPAVEADPGALGAVSGEGPDAGAREASGVVAIGTTADYFAEIVAGSAPAAQAVPWDGRWDRPWPAEQMIDRGFINGNLAREHSCVLGRRAVSATHECLGAACAAWRWGPDCVDTTRRFGFCGLAVRP